MKEALKLALEALQLVSIEFVCNGAHHARKDRHDWLESCPVVERYQVAITAAREALEQPDYRAVKTYHEGKPVYVSQPEQEPVAWTVVGDGKFGKVEIGHHAETDLDACSYWVNRGYSLVPLYTTPPKRPWVGLTDGEIDSYFEDHGWSPSEDYYPVIKDIEAKLKEKNT